ncbi:MAG: ATP-dependent sacrificial sulfur transferase LarE [Fuerstiella sp.]|jgi:uncharacterized protein|nr:ATP-dependent sacrificial sulfur transferase LarE [Fuerstiella sp.]MDG2129246.1 ATP-dependent sacrificial sulfur transferase LarE [Fuerstiella sp.]
MTITSANSNTFAATETLAGNLVKHVYAYGPVAVAFSGGVDSAVVARAAVEAFGDKAVAVTAVSHSLATSELQIARSEAVSIGIRHVEVATNEFERPEYRANTGNRCFFCKDTLYRITASKLSDLGVSVMVNGANTDDLGDHRPGMKAAQEHHVRSPLIEVGINKSQVRQLARFWSLSVAEKPASPCLSSRIAYHVEVTRERVHRVERAEAFLHALTGLNQLRVRYEADEMARIEVPLESVSHLTTDAVRMAVTVRLKELGFRRVTLDLEGFRSGSLNDVLPMVQLGDAAE